MIDVHLETEDERQGGLEVERLAFDTDREVEVVLAVRDEPGAFALVARGDPVGGSRLQRAVRVDPGLSLGLRNPWAGETADGFVIEEEEDQPLVRFDGREISGDVVGHPAFG